MVTGREVVDLRYGYCGDGRGRHTGDAARSGYCPDPSSGDRIHGNIASHFTQWTMAGVLLQRERKERYLCGPFSEYAWREVGDFDGRWDGAALVPSRSGVVLPRCFRQSRGSWRKCQSDVLGWALDNALSRRRIRIQPTHPTVRGGPG